MPVCKNGPDLCIVMSASRNSVALICAAMERRKIDNYATYVERAMYKGAIARTHMELGEFCGGTVPFSNILGEHTPFPVTSLTTKPCVTFQVLSPLVRDL